MDINLDKLITPNFKDIVTDIIDCNIGKAILKGGRNSCKSQFAGYSLLIGCMVYKSSAVALVKHDNKKEERLVNTIKDCIGRLGIEKWWKLRKSPLEYVLLDRKGKETNISIKFTGCDNAEMIKSFKPRLGSFRYIWIEEATNFNGINEINNIIQTMARGAGDHCVIMTYNPPMSTSHWINKEFDTQCGKVLGYDSDTNIKETIISVGNETHIVKEVVHHSTYLDIVQAGHSDWCGLVFLSDAEQSKKNNPTYYNWNFLGDVVGTDANVFFNIHDWVYNEDNLNITKINKGLDCSNGGKDPWMYGNWYYDKVNNNLYCLDEMCLGGGASIDQVALGIKSKNPLNSNFYIDGAIPTFAKLLRNAGVNPTPAKKGKDSVIAGILWLQSLNHIYIDKNRTPITYKEFKEYEYKLDKDDNVTSELKDEDNHSIDACRYAMCMSIKYNW